MSKPQDWFEMSNVRKRSSDRDVWISLKEGRALITEGSQSRVGFAEEYLGVTSIAVPETKRAEAAALEWRDVLLRTHRGYVDEEDGEYVPAHIYRHDESLPFAEELVVVREGNTAEPHDWLLNQDLVVTLRLKQEGDVWLAINYGYEEVVRLERDAEGQPVCVAIKASYLKDYLRARRMGLAVLSYRSRVQIVEDATHVAAWLTSKTDVDGGDRWEGRVAPIHEGDGGPFGGQYKVIHLSRTDVDFDEDVPTPGPASDANITYESRSGQPSGRKVYRIAGELWRNEWVRPALRSTIALDEEAESRAFFTTDNAGTTESRRTLVGGIRWLWFRPGVVNALLAFRGSSLRWHTGDTGRIECSPGYGVHFGVNRMGLVNVFAKDIGMLPDWQQLVWVGHNVAPDGKVCEELLMSQMEARPASTRAPEADLAEGLALLEQRCRARHGVSILREHDDVPQLLQKVHRFRALHSSGLLELAKDLYRLVGERIDDAEIKRIIKPAKGEKWGDLKSLERLLAVDVGEGRAYALLGPLWGVYKLRQADSHLPPDSLEEAYRLCGIDPGASPVAQGRQLLRSVVHYLYEAAQAMDRERPVGENA